MNLTKAEPKIRISISGHFSKEEHKEVTKDKRFLNTVHGTDAKAILIAFRNERKRVIHEGGEDFEALFNKS